MKFKLKKRGVDDAKKILIYGNDGTGKSTFAETYCKEHGLNPIVIDVDDTNYTNCDILDLNLTNDVRSFNAVKEAIQQIAKSDYDTIILDGVSSLIEMFVSNDKGIKKYEVRNDRFNKILKEIRISGKNIIFVGQADLRVVVNEDHQSNKLIIKTNSIVNEKYHCYIDSNGKYAYEVEKCRVVEPKEDEKPKKVQEEPKASTLNTIDSSKEIAMSIYEELPSRDMTSAKIELSRLLKNGIISKDECPGIIKELEKIL